MSIKTIKENKIFENNFFQIFNDDVEFENNHQGTHIKMSSLPLPKQIAVLAIDKDFKVIIQDEYRYAIQRSITQCVAGGVKPGESFEDAARTELDEELGLEAESFFDAGSFLTEPGIMIADKRAFIALNCTEKLQSKEKDASEVFVNKRTIDLSDLLDDVLSGKIECVTTQMLVLKAAFLIDRLK
jgi:ADP-ribose pyrophosphatase